jgi:hypothetical protein
LPAGDYAIVASARMWLGSLLDGGVRDVYCELRADAGVIGSADDRRVIPEGEDMRVSLALNGGAHLPAGGEVSLWCDSQEITVTALAQLMIMKVGGFF